jgi:superkiller protein 3
MEARDSEAAAWIRTRPIAVELAVALDNWAMARRENWTRAHREGSGNNDGSWRDLLAVARAADPDPLRTQVRQALETSDRAALERLARTVAATDLPATTLHLIGGALEELRAFAPAIALLREGQRRYPGDFWLNQRLGLLLDKAKPPQRQEALRFLSVAVALRPQSAGAYLNLGLALDRQGRVDEAIAACRQAIELRPFEAKAYRSIVPLLQKQGRPEEAVSLCRKAVELKPDSVEAYANLGNALREQGKLSEAVEAFHKAIELDPSNFDPYGGLANTLRLQGRLDEAVAACRKTIALKPDCEEAYNQLAIAFKEQRRTDEAVAAWHKAIELNPDYVTGYWNLGGLLDDLGRTDEAIAMCRKAIELKPDEAEAHCNLAAALLHQGRRDEAVAAFRKAIELKPDLANAYDGLGNALEEQGRLDEAMTVFRKRIELQPNDPDGYYNLGIVLKGQGRVDEAMAAYRKAIALKPDYAEAYCNLANLFQGQEKFEEALAHYQRGHELGSRNPRWSYPSAQWVSRCERLVALDRKLPAILKGKVQPTDVAERLDLASICCRAGKQRYAVAARFFAEAFEAQPALADDLQRGCRYSAACAAALAGCGRGMDAADLGDEERTRLREQALRWLRADLNAWHEQRGRESDKIRPLVVKTLQHWMLDTDLTGVRSSEGLARLPEAEQQRWREFWGDVQRLLDQVKINAPAASRR